MTQAYQSTDALIWNRSTLFSHPDGEDLKRYIYNLDISVAEFEKMRTHLTPSIEPSLFLSVIHQYELIIQHIKHIEGYAEVCLAEDVNNQIFQAFYTSTQQYIAQLNQRIDFFITWWKDLDEKVVYQLIQSSTPYMYWLQKQRSLIPYTLPPHEEHIINIKDTTGIHSLQNLYDMITNRYMYTIFIDGETQHVPGRKLAPYSLGSDRDVRFQAVQEVYRVFEQDSLILGTIYQSVVRTWIAEHIQLRGFETAISARNKKNDIPDNVIDTFLTTAQNNAPVFHRYLDLKAAKLNIDDMRVSDVFVSIDNNISTTAPVYPLSTAIDLLSTIFEAFDPTIATIVKELHIHQRVDTQSRQGKKRGAWCFAHTPHEQPWISVSYDQTLNDVLMLAHEYGHAIHAVLAGKQTMLNYDISLPLAETASLFTEMLVFDYLITQEHDPSIRTMLQFRRLDDALLSIHRYIAFTRFEQEVYGRMQDKGDCSIDDFAHIYRENLQYQFGDNIYIPESMQWEWLTFPVLYYEPFYSYSYAFGHLLALALYQEYKIQGHAFVSRYLQILRAGGSADPITILQHAGFDVADPSFWQAGFDMINSMIQDLV